MSENESSQDPRDARLEHVVKLLSLLYSLICLVYVVWMVIPAHQKRLLAMTVTSRLQNGARKAAFRAGHQAMGLEIRGCGANYSCPYLLSLAAEKAGRVYEKLRYTA